MYTSHLLNISGITHGFGHAGVELCDYVPDDVVIHRTHQVHGNAVHVLDDEQREDILNGDAFITSQPNIACFVRTADCVPILVADINGRAVGVIHAGWRGTVKDIAGEAVRTMCDRFGVEPGDVRAAIGPAICRVCYQVGDEVIDAFRSVGLSADRHLDLKGANRDLLIRTGVAQENIETIDVCTCCGDGDLASYRKDNTAIRQVSFIVISSPLGKNSSNLFLL